MESKWAQTHDTVLRHLSSYLTLCKFEILFHAFNMNPAFCQRVFIIDDL